MLLGRRHRAASTDANEVLIHQLKRDPKRKGPSPRRRSATKKSKDKENESVNKNNVKLVSKLKRELSKGNGLNLILPSFTQAGVINENDRYCGGRDRPRQVINGSRGDAGTVGDEDDMGIIF